MTAPAPPERDERRTRAALDEAIRAANADRLSDGEIIVNWIVLAGTRNHHGGGYVLTTLHDGMPRWEAEGLLRRGLKHIDYDVDEDTTTTEEEDE